MTPRLRAAGLAGLALAALPMARAAAETRIVQGQQLVLTVRSAQDVAIRTDRTLSGQVRVSMDGTLNCLSVIGGQAAIVTAAGCEDSDTLHVDVSPDAMVTLTSSGSGDIHLDDLSGLLVATLEGGGDLVGGHVGGTVLSVHSGGGATLGQVDGPLTVEILGGGDVHVQRVRGPLTGKLHGAGDLVVGGIEADAVVIDGSGAGDTMIGPGTIDTLRLRQSGTGDVSVAAKVRNADVEAHGNSDVRLAAVSGMFNHTATGDATVTLADADGTRSIASAVAAKLDRDSADEHAAGQGSSALTDVLMVALLALVAFIGWRTLRRPGGFAGLRRGAAAGPSNPGVVALGATMARLEQRLGRLESYVTTREFDLSRKIREL